MRLAIIPARGGSKRIPRKNIKVFHGKPMIAWSIDVALKSKLFDEVWVSTDDDEIARVAKSYGAKTPFIRPSELSNDFAPTIDVVAHAITEFKKLNNHTPEYVCCIYATAPFILKEDLINGLKKIEEKEDLDFIFSATSFPFPIQRAIKLNQNKTVEMFYPDLFNTRSQDLEEAWHDAGQFYWGTPNAWLEKSPIFSNRSSIIELPRARVQDIDTMEDWHCAEIMAKFLLEP